MKKIISLTLITLLLGIWFPPVVQADDWYDQKAGYFTMLDEAGNELTMMARQMFLDDEYISGDNKHYRITKVDKGKKQAEAEYLGDIELPEVELADIALFASAMTAQKKPGNILLYCTHTDESYVPTDGAPSEQNGGGILDVAASFKKSLQKRGINVVFDETNHVPHDAGAYRRSRVTALELIKKNMPVAAIFDIHRDAVPKAQYVTKVDGDYMTKIRMVIGKRNQNRKANEELAYKIKAVADKAYPGLMKDIYIGKGEYNQELSPRSLLFEIGTHENSKEAAEKAAGYLGDIVSKAMFGGSMAQKNQEGQKTGEINPRPINAEKTQGGGRGILWLIGILVVGGVGFLLLSSGGREMFSKASNFTRQEFSSFLGRKKKK